MCLYIYIYIVKGSTRLTAGCFCQPPSTSHYIFYTLADSIIFIKANFTEEFLLIGDINVDIEHGFGPRLTDLMTTFGLTQVVKSPTHISTSGSKTTIDLSYISNPINLQSCVTKPPITTSDHNSIIVTMTCQQALSGQ